MDSFEGFERSVYAGEVTESLIGSMVTLMGWVQRRRDHGGLIFVDLRDHRGLVQLVFNPEHEAEVHTRAHALRSEFVLAVRGRVEKRPPETENPELKTGMVEVMVTELRILNDSAQLPFLIEDDTDAGEDIRLKYRYLDLRRPSLQDNLILRHKVTKAARDFLSAQDFFEIETPVLTKSTPEGARDYLVPSRLNPGRFFALPQSPQIFKQLLMVAGFDRYFHIARCFRDEDLRADRQPEFTQIDAEMSFVNAGDVMGIMEGLITAIFDVALGVELTTPFPRLTYADALSRYGLDCPDNRFALELTDLTEVVKGSGFKVFDDAAAREGYIVKGLNATGCAEFSRKDLDDLTDLAVRYGAKGLAWVKVTEEGWQSPIAKFLSDDTREGVAAALEAKPGDLLLFGADKAGVSNTVLGRVRIEIAKRLGLLNGGAGDVYNFVWVTDFPLLEYDEETKRHYAVHHPFAAPLEEDIEKLESEPLKVRAAAYDLVLNGTEIGGGSLRIHRRDVQQKVFEKLGMSEDEAGERFGFLLEALSFGTPPHGGIAFGLDRLVAIMAGAESIRDVIAFPKTQKAACMMSEAPSVVDKAQLEELFIRAAKAEKKDS